MSLDLVNLIKSSLNFPVLYPNYDDRFFQQCYTETFPQIDVYENVIDKTYCVEIACVSFDSKDLKVEIENDLLIIKGDSQKENSARYLLKEISRKSFERRVRLPEYVVGEPVVKTENGIVKLTWKISQVLPKRVSVKIK